MAYRHEIRQGSVIQGSGPGALSVLKEGMSVIIPGLDSWYRKDGNFVATDDGIPNMTKFQDIPDKCRILDPNLAKELDVDFFVFPPATGLDFSNKHTEYLNVSVFPTWTICYNCRTLAKITSAEKYLPFCPACLATEKKRRKVVQVNFVIVCPNGHIDEFPWRQWVHKSQHPGCPSTRLIMESSGSGDLSGQSVTCDDCKATRRLTKTNQSDEKGTYLSHNLSADGDVFLCTGARPWLAESEPCVSEVRLILRNASNLYYSQQVSSILVPEKAKDAHPLDEHIDAHYVFINAELFLSGNDYTEVANKLRYGVGLEFKNFTIDGIADRLKKIFDSAQKEAPVTDDSVSLKLKTPEWNALKLPQESEVLRVRSVEYASQIPGVVGIHAVPTLTKTTAMAGFSRLMPTPLDIASGKKLLRRQPHLKSARWLPAIQYVGEGIFIELDPKKLLAWESQSNVIERVSRIESNLIKYNRSNPDEPNTPRRVLLHTLAHVLIQQLVIEGGYIAASLSERIYASEEMAGILIYTASSDADGTMGGLVEQAKPDLLATALQRSLEACSWCSNDTVCMELGKDGQGMYGANLAACHNCCLLPETSCEYFNLGLDRALLVGDTTDVDAFTGFFAN